MPISSAMLQFDQPNHVPAVFPRDVSEPMPCGIADQQAYFEIYYAERVSLTSILFSGGDWRWRFCSAAGVPVAASAGYPSENACAAAVAVLRASAGSATVRVAH